MEVILNKKTLEYKYIIPQKLKNTNSMFDLIGRKIEYKSCDVILQFTKYSIDHTPCAVLLTDLVLYAVCDDAIGMMWLC